VKFTKERLDELAAALDGDALEQHLIAEDCDPRLPRMRADHVQVARDYEEAARALRALGRVVELPRYEVVATIERDDELSWEHNIKPDGAWISSDALRRVLEESE
jgi:hypothetical protein